MVSLASAVALTMTMVEKQMARNNGTIPIGANLFSPLLDEHVRIPVTSEINFDMSFHGEDMADCYDFYFFQVSQSIHFISNRLFFISLTMLLRISYS